ncbi:phosphotransferase [Streptomyces formicae]|uniref:Aminoglycoside phosphotransferase n=1 Tax=Streptomyces formicae TaxID=1616117 RepID=A0A291QLT6_9ACTN|nr:phosphotransferase [Streptomyces formicae]ATL32528.1 Aminoglycoside phosphotransferase [Streptomyces formicae]
MYFADRGYADIARRPLPFATPEIFDVEDHDGVLVTHERELPVRDVDALLAVLRALAPVPGTDAMRQLTVRGDDGPLWRDHDCFRDALAAHVPDFEAGVARTRKALRSLPDAPVAAIHGDLAPPNIHVDAEGRPVAVLDLGFCTTVGDPAFA